MPTRVARRSGVERLADLAWWAALAGYVALLAWLGLPRSPEFEAFEIPTQLAFLGVGVVGGLLARSRPAMGGGILLLGGVGLGVLASVAYHPLFAWTAVLPFCAPGLLYLVAAAQRETTGAALLSVSVVVVLAVAGGLGSRLVYDAFQGPTHPQSEARLPESAIRWLWMGGADATSVRMTARLVRPGDDVRLEVGDATSGEPGELVSVTVDADGVVSATATGLKPGTGYRYQWWVNGVVDRVGTVATLPEGPSDFRLVVSSCAREGSNGVVFQAIAAEHPDLFLIAGDLHYANIGVDDPGAFLAAYDRALTPSAPASLYASTPVAYVWDDHDYGSNDANADSPSRPAALSTYRQVVPSYPLEVPESLAHAFTIGRVRFIVTDTRSQRSPQSDPDGPGKSMLGDAQKAWFFGELATSVGAYPLVVWVNPDPWIGPAQAGADTWAGYTHERTEIADFIAGLEGGRIAMVSGDAHMVAIDDGTNSDYSMAGGGGFPVLHAAALDRPGGVKGGPYSHGTFPGGGQYAVMDVVDAAASVDEAPSLTVTWRGARWDGTELVSYRFTVPGGRP